MASIISRKIKFSLYEKGSDNNVTLKLNAVDNQWLVVKILTDTDTQKFPMCLLEVKELKQFLNENYPEL